MNADRIVSLSAIVVAIGTLSIIVYRTHLTREAQQAIEITYSSIYGKQWAIRSNEIVPEPR
jgi:hypothetical protein